MTQAEDIAVRILVHRYPVLPFKPAASDLAPQPPALPGTTEPRLTTASDLERRIAAAIRTPADLSLIFTLAQACVPAPYFDSYIPWLGVRPLLQPNVGDPCRAAALNAALADIAEVMRVLVERTSVYDPEAEPAIRLSLALIDGLRAAVTRMHGVSRCSAPSGHHRSGNSGETVKIFPKGRE